MFRFGVEKGRLFYFVFVGAFVALIFVFGEWLSALLAGDAALPVLLLARGCRAADFCRAFCGRLRQAVLFLTGLRKITGLRKEKRSRRLRFFV